MKIMIAFSTVVLGLSANIALAFDITTHVAMTAKAVEQSKFGSAPNTSELIARLGLRDSEGVFGSRYIGFGSPLRSRVATSWEKRWMKEVRDSISTLPTDFTMVGWLMRGAVREDDNIAETPLINQTDNDPAPVFNRVFGHFFNPVGNAGLITSQSGRRGPTAPDWALVPNANIPDGAFGSRENNYKISDAREAMWRALTLKQILANGTLEQITPIGGLVSFAADEAERKAYWAATFRTLGDAMHLLQDMAQPQHTRLDSHSGFACLDPNNPDGICAGGHASFFENYLKARTLQSGAFSLDETSSISVPPVPGSGATRLTTRPQLNYAGYAIPSFANYRDFFATDTGAASATGRGLANYSNRGFYSFGTNINDSLFLAPSPTGVGLGSESITGDAFTDMTGRKLPGALKVRTGIVEVEFFNSSSLIATLTASPYNFRWGNVVAGSYTVTARVTDSRGLGVTSAPLTVTVGSAVTIQVAAGLNGSTVNEDAIYISGTVSAPPNSAVNVNGQLTTLTSGGQFFLNDLNLQAGTNTVTATVTAPDGQTANQVITVTRSAVASTFTVSVTSSGLAAPGSPFNADVTIENPSNTPFAIATVQCEDPGAGLDITQLGTLTCTYAAPGIYDVRVTVRDALGGVIYAVVKRVTVVMPQALYNSIVSIYNGVTDRLKAGNIDGALNAFTRSVREKYRIAFTEVGTNLPAIVNSFGVMSGASINANFAELIIVKTTAQGDVATPVILGLGADGIWRIDGF
ncbi:MAG: hypothetical protein H7232_15610 [Aeromicrobium sp.]|nr:hypothetical protein [Burkholderiales bacterium]